MKRARALFIASLLASPAAHAAEITRIASSFDPDHPFGMFLDIGYERTQWRELITQEAHQKGGVQDVNQFRYTMIDSRLKIDAYVGLWQDVQFHFGVPLIFSQDRTWGFDSQANGAPLPNCYNADGSLTNASCATAPGNPGARPMFNMPNQSYRGGLGDMTFGLAYAFFNTKRDDTKPVWIAGLDYTAPTSNLLDPSQPTDPTHRGNMGDKVHRYQFYTALSKRNGIADPYMKIHYTLPVRGPGWYSNCDNANSANMGAPDNCGTGAWARTDTGILPPHVGGIIVGSEFNAYEEPSHHQKVAIDLQGIATYVSEGRYYNEMSDLFGKYLYTQEYLQVGGKFGLYAHAADFVAIQLSATLLYNTEHWLTYEPIGKDLNGDGVVDVTDPAQRQEINPNFDSRTDMVSRRFRAVDGVVFTLNATATFSF
jgi:hypothetical protein